ncbi:MAG: hypothetical protein KTR31_03305 [Myxococcales bacterium]|nr:hypothetical protein [Myxococcales bacterium]
MIGLVLAFLFACPKPPPILNPVDWTEPPRLPSPTAGSYARVKDTPPDPGVRQVLGSRDWDASLSGAAAGVALEVVLGRGGLTPPEIREAAWRAGWMYPVQRVQTVGASIGAGPPQALRPLLAGVPSGSDIGLVRARGDQQDLWVLLTSTPRKDLGVFPRQLARGARLKLPAMEGVRFAVADPQGKLSEGHLDVEWSTGADTDGEWLVELRDQGGLLARFPIYVGLVPPDGALLRAGDAPANAQEAVAQVQEVLASVRSVYGLRSPQVDTLLQSAVPWVQLNRSLTASEIGARVGVEEGSMWRFDCTADTVEICLDEMVWDPRARPALLADQLLLGIGADLAPNGVHVTLLMAKE